MLDFEYPYTDFGSINLNFILALCKETLGIHLDIDDHTLSLLNFEGTTISSVDLPTEAIGDIAEMAKKDVNGKNLTSYAASLSYDSETNTLTLKSGANTTLAEFELNNGGGTDVVANPTGASTADLTKIKIGNVIYSIPTADLTNYYTKTQVDSKLSAKANTSDLATVATSGSYNDLSNTPTIPAAQVQSDWAQTDNTKKDYIKNKPSIPTGQVQSDWNQTNSAEVDYIKNKPTIPDAQVQSNWNESDSSSKAYIQNKPTIPNVPSSSGANAGDVLTHTTNGDAWLPVPKEIPTYTSSDASKVLSVNSAGNNIEWATAGGGGGGGTDLPALPVEHVPADVQQQMNLKGSVYSDGQGGYTKTYSWDPPLIDCQYDSTLETNSAWDTSYTCPYDIPAFSFVPFVIVANCGDTAVEYSVPLPYKTSYYTPNVRAVTYDTWQTIYSQPTDGFVSLSNLSNYKSVMPTLGDVFSGQHVSKDFPINNIEIYARINHVTYNNTLYRVLSGYIHNITNSALQNYTIKPKDLAHAYFTNYYMDLT